MPATESAFLEAAKGRVPRHTPVWFMRQAGRSLPEYRSLRGNGSILDTIKRPDIAAELTLQPVRRYGVDAAILFSDIVVPVHAIGFGVDIVPGTGPVVDEPFRTTADIRRLRPFEPETDAPYVAETVAAVAASAAVPVIAFAGAPFTVASYLIEGRPSRLYENTKGLMRTDEATWSLLMSRLTDICVASLRSQLDAGAAAFQLFDSWVGTLSRPDYERFVLPHTRKVYGELATSHPDTPGIHFGLGCDHLLEMVASTGPTVIGLDWRTTLHEARGRLGAGTVLQGNLDPALVLCGVDVATAAAERVMLDNAGNAGHVFNLGHGVIPTTDPGVLAAVVERVHERTEGMLVDVRVPEPAPGPEAGPIAETAGAQSISG